MSTTPWHASDDLAARYADGSLPETDAWSLEKHLERCGACAARVSAAVRRSPAAGPVLAAIREAVLREATPNKAAVFGGTAEPSEPAVAVLREAVGGRAPQAVPTAPHPALPARPVHHVHPADPARPVDPARPAHHAHPARPVDPARPAHHAHPARPVDPARPTGSTVPTASAGSARPARPLPPPSRPTPPARSAHRARQWSFFLVRALWAAGPAVRGAWLPAVSLVALGALGLSHAGGADAALPLLLALAPLAPVAGVALSYGVHADPLHEIAAATPSGGLRLILTRTAAVLAVSLPLLTLTGLLLPAAGAPGAAAWLLPGLALTLASLTLAGWVGCRAATAPPGTAGRGPG
jgi:hypothetical protein